MTPSARGMNVPSERVARGRFAADGYAAPRAGARGRGRHSVPRVRCDRVARLFMLLVALSACDGGDGGVAGSRPNELAGAPERVAALGALPGVQAIHRDIALVCEPMPASGSAPGEPAGSDSVDAIPDCDAVIVDGAGVTRPLGRGGLLAAQRFGAIEGDDGALLLLRRDLTLVLRDRTGRERAIATAVADPRVADDGRRVVLTELPPGTTELVPGLSTRIVLLDLAAGARRVITDDPLASAPFVVPGSGDVLYVSSRTGVASFWLASPGRAPRQITNVGLKRLPAAGWTPVAGRDLVWQPGTRRAVYTASYAGAHDLWSIDVDTGAATRLGPGRWAAGAGASSPGPSSEVTP